MANETLSIPEEYLPDVIRIIQNGLAETPSYWLEGNGAAEHLAKWCDETEAYLKRVES